MAAAAENEITEKHHLSSVVKKRHSICSEEETQKLTLQSGSIRSGTSNTQGTPPTDSAGPVHALWFTSA